MSLMLFRGAGEKANKLAIVLIGFLARKVRKQASLYFIRLKAAK